MLLPTKVSTQSFVTEKENSERTLKVIRHSPLVVKLQDLKERVLRAGYLVCDAEAGSGGLTWDLLKCHGSHLGLLVIVCTFVCVKSTVLRKISVEGIGMLTLRL